MRLLFIFIYLLFFSGLRGQSYHQLTDLPTLYIEVYNGDDIISKENYIDAKIVYVDGKDIRQYENTQVRVRGNSTFYAEKKPYKLKFATKQALLGNNHAKAKSWTLLANHSDKTMIRNALTYDLGNFFGFSFCPAAQFVDLYLNGNYRGTYQISDQVEVRNKRVDIDENNGWLLELTDDIHKDEPYIVTDRNIYVNVKNPKDENLTDVSLQSITEWCNQLSHSIWSEDYKSTITGYRSMIHEKSFIDWYIATELTGNIDAFSSIYTYKDTNNALLCFGPLWDEDLGYNNSSEKDLEKCLLAFANRNHPIEETMHHIWEDPWFAQSVYQRWKELLDAGIQQYLLEKIDSLRNVIYQSQQENFKQWSITEPIFSFERHLYHDTYDEYVNDLKKYINHHIPFMTEEFYNHYIVTNNNSVHFQPISTDNSLYHLDGRIVNTPVKHGIYIKNHQKIIY